MRVAALRRTASGILLFSILGVGPTVVFTPPAEAQQLKGLKDRAKEVVRAGAALTTEQLLAHALRCVYDDPECIENAKAANKPVVLTDDEGTVLTNEDGEPITDPAQLPAEQREGAVGKSAGEVTVQSVENGEFSFVVSPWSDLSRSGSAIASVRASRSGEPGDSTGIVRFCFLDRHGEFQPVVFEDGEWVSGRSELALGTGDAEREINLHFFGTVDSARLEGAEEGYLNGWVRGTVVPLVNRNASPQDRQDFVLSFSAAVRHPQAPDGNFGTELNCPEP